MHHELESKVALITGASKGIGAGIATAFGQAGAKVVVGFGGDHEAAERNYDVVVLGDQGDDQATFQVSNNGGTPIFGPTLKAQLDGGLGNDLLTNNSKPLSKATGWEQVI